MSSTTAPAGEKAAKGILGFVDDHLGGSAWLRKTMNKVFPDHWSFMLGEISLYSFIILLLTGTFLTLFFTASPHEVVYQGSYVPLRGVSMSEAYASTLNITFDVRGGLLMRQIHHWAALVFVASIMVHMCRVFFTGAFRKPRELNWVVGTILLIVSFLEGFAGYSLPDDLLSGTGLRIAYSIAESVPVVGTWAAYLLFGGNSPGSSIIQRLYVIHILLIPGLFMALITAHMLMLVRQKHTDFPGPGKTEDTVVGVRMFPTFAIKAGGFFFIVFGVLALMGGLVQINPIWLYGPYNPGNVSAGSQPDWYIGFLDGSVRMMPNWETNIWGHTISWNLLVPGLILPGIMFNLLGAWPWVERKFTKDYAHHNLLQRPRDNPTRTGIGVAGIVFYMVMWANGGNDIMATTFGLSLNSLTWTFRVLLFVGPVIAYQLTKRIAIGLQRRDQDIIEHGVESGRIERLPSGGFIEVHVEDETLPSRHLVDIQHEFDAIESGHEGGEIATVDDTPAPPAKPRGFFRPKAPSR